jgi:hypothetical protein
MKVQSFVSKPVLNRLEGGLALGLLSVVLIPLVVLSFYNHPSPADDYCYIDTVFKYGWLEAMHYYYTGWTGRYFGILLNHSNPLILHWMGGFTVLPLLLLAGLLGAFWALLAELLPSFSPRTRFLMLAVLFFLCILQLPDIAGALYWMASFVTYTVPAIATLVGIVIVLRIQRLDTSEKGLYLALSLFAAFLVFASIGSSETNLMITLVLVGGWWVFRLVVTRHVNLLMGLLALTTVLSCYLFFSAEGNATRLGGNPLSGNIPFSFISSFKTLALLVIGWLRKTPLLAFTLLWMAVLSKHPLPASSGAYFGVPFWYAGLVYVGVMAAQLFPSYYGVGIEPAPRAINNVYLFFVLGWFYLVTVGWIHYAPRLFHLTSDRSLIWIGAICVGMSLYTAYASANIRGLYRDWLRGNAAAYDREMTERYRLLRETTATEVSLPALQHLPYALYVEDIKDNPEHWWNKCMAGYFGKEKIYLITTSNE